MNHRLNKVLAESSVQFELIVLTMYAILPLPLPGNLHCITEAAMNLLCKSVRLYHCVP